MNDPVKVLAGFLTNPKRVTGASIGLEIGGQKKAEAQEFFELRSAFGVNGYVTIDEAETAIRRSLGG